MGRQPESRDAFCRSPPHPPARYNVDTCWRTPPRLTREVATVRVCSLITLDANAAAHACFVAGSQITHLDAGLKNRPRRTSLRKPSGGHYDEGPKRTSAPPRTRTPRKPYGVWAAGGGKMQVTSRPSPAHKQRYEMQYRQACLPTREYMRPNRGADHARELACILHDAARLGLVIRS
ncbi:hypothetical protein LZ32DRAFT_286775 [Colletotrichum eremochloae]|nr:hypothetical protein LZ32DRAFT_286775 [Colletotrichum eremochloae]